MLFYASVAAKYQNIHILFLIKIKKLPMKSFSHVELVYDVALRRNIPVNILFTSLTTHNIDPKILSGWM